MRIWDINPGYLNDKSLLGEHVELHGLVSILKNNKKGYSHHPETKRWSKYHWAIKKRHQLLVSEMKLRGFNHKSPIEIDSKEKVWPKNYIDTPQNQFNILSKKYEKKNSGRIPLPISAQNLWSQHKYSVMARDVNEYKKIGNYVSKIKLDESFEQLSLDLVDLLRMRPSEGGIRNSLQHMWGYFKNNANLELNMNSIDSKTLIKSIGELAYRENQLYILSSTAISDLRVWM